jgi:hypothetical protein
VQGMQDKIVNAMEKNSERLQYLVDRMSKDMEATQAMNVAKLANKEKELASKGVDNRINALKTLFTIYPPGSQEWKNALLSEATPSTATSKAATSATATTAAAAAEEATTKATTTTTSTSGASGKTKRILVVADMDHIHAGHKSR